jgi:hypothetical protein
VTELHRSPSTGAMVQNALILPTLAIHVCGIVLKHSSNTGKQKSKVNRLEMSITIPHSAEDCNYVPNTLYCSL